MKKILLIADSNMSLSGVPVVFMSIVRQLHQEYLFDIVVLKNNDMYFEKEFLSYGGKVYYFPFDKPDGFLKKLKWLTSYYKEVRDFLKRNLNLNDYQAIHSFNEGFSYPFLKEAQKAGINSRLLHICSAASAYPFKKIFAQKIFNWYQKKAKKYATNLIFVSEQSLKLNDYSNKGVVLYNMYDEKKFGNIIDCDHDKLVLTQIGTFSHRKNQLFALEVINKVKETINDATLKIVGFELDDGYLCKMIDYIKGNKLDKNVVFEDKSKDRIELAKETSYILYPSTMESFGLVLIESQACGIHCFANKDIPNDADMGNTDFLPLDAGLWANKIIDYYKENKNKRTQPINTEKFSSQQFVKTVDFLYGK